MSRKGYLYRYENSKFVPYEVMERTVVEVHRMDLDIHKCPDNKRIMFKVAVHHETEAIPHYQLTEEGFYDNLADLTSAILLAEAHKELEKTRRAGMVDGNTIARMRANEKEFRKLTNDLFNAFTEITLNSPFQIPVEVKPDGVLTKPEDVIVGIAPTGEEVVTVPLGIPVDITPVEATEANTGPVEPIDLENSEWLGLLYIGWNKLNKDQRTRYSELKKIYG